MEVKREEVVRSASSPSVSGAALETAPLRQTQGRMSGPTRRSTKGRWTEEEDNKLIIQVQQYNGRNWKKIAESFPGRTDVQCLHRWQKVLNPDLIKGPWSKEEDDQIIELVAKHGCKKWSVIAKSLPGRIGKQCRERWHNHLNPSIKKDAWTEAEEVALIRAHQIYGNKWAEIARFLPGRADNSIKNHWNCSVKKKLGSYVLPGLLGELPYNVYSPKKEEKNVASYVQGTNGATMFSLGQHAELPIIANDFHNSTKEGEIVRTEVDGQNGDTIIPVDRSVDCKNDAETCMEGSRFSNMSAVMQHLDLQSVQIKVLEYSKEEAKNLKKVECESDYDSSRLRSSAGARCKDVLNTSDDSHSTWALKADASFLAVNTKGLPLQAVSHEPSNNTDESDKPFCGHITLAFSSPSITRTYLPLEVSSHATDEKGSSETTPSITTKEIFSSPKESQQNAFAGKGIGVMTFNSKADSTASSLQASEFDTQVCSQDNIYATPKQFEASRFGSLCYEPLNLNSSNPLLSTGDTLEHFIEKVHIPAYSTPSVTVQGISYSGSSPDSILRNAARTFKNMPSILRKRGRGISKVLPMGTPQTANACVDQNGACTPEMRDGSFEDSTGSTHSDNVNCSELLSVKRLFLSPDPLIPRYAASVKSVGRILENVFEDCN